MFRRRTAALVLVSALLIAGCTRQVSPEVQKELERQYPELSSSSQSSAASQADAAKSEQETEQSASSSEPEEPETYYTEASLKAVGDNLIHNTIYLQAANRAGDGQDYDFYPAYEHVAPLLEGADIAFINQETLLASEVFEVSTYPMFNSPTELGDTMLDLGFNLFAHANNHALDKGVKGINATLDYWDSKLEDGEELLVSGIFRDEADMNEPRIIEKNGISFALVAFTEHTNGLKLPSNVENRIIYTSETELMEEQIKTAAKKADIVLVSVHWGVENSHTVTDAQRALAQQFVDWGADVILGSHPHVLQSIEKLTSTDGEDTAYVIYSLGNFISAQAAGDNLVGGVFNMTFEKEHISGVITMSEPTFVPIVTHYETAWQKNLALYPLSEYSPDMAASHGVIRNTPAFSVEYIESMLDEVIGVQYLDYTPWTPPVEDEEEPAEGEDSSSEAAE